MHLQVTLDLPADARAAGRMLAEESYVHAKVAATGATDQQVEIQGEASGPFTVTTRRALPTDQIPAQVRGFIGNQLDVRQVEAWESAAADGSRAGTIALEIAGAPVRLTGAMRLEVLGEGTSRLVYDGELKATVPLFGAAVEQAASGAVRQGLAVEQQVAVRWLEEHAAG